MTTTVIVIVGTSLTIPPNLKRLAKATKKEKSLNVNDMCFRCFNSLGGHSDRCPHCGQIVCE